MTPETLAGFVKDLTPRKQPADVFARYASVIVVRETGPNLQFTVLANLETEMKVRRFVPKYIYITYYYIIYTYMYKREEVTKMISPTYQFYHPPPGGEVHDGPRDTNSDAGGLSKFSWPSSSCAWNQSLGPVSVCKMFVCRLFDRICGL